MRRATHCTKKQTLPVTVSQSSDVYQPTRTLKQHCLLHELFCVFVYDLVNQPSVIYSSESGVFGINHSVNTNPESPVVNDVTKWYIPNTEDAHCHTWVQRKEVSSK